MAVYGWAVDLALTLISQYGTLSQLRVYTNDTTDPDNPNPSTPVDHPAQAVMFDYTYQQSGEIIAAGGTFKTGDKQVYVAAKNVTVRPTVGDKFVDNGGTVWTMENVKILAPNVTELILFELQVRK